MSPATFSCPTSIPGSLQIRQPPALPSTYTNTSPSTSPAARRSRVGWNASPLAGASSTMSSGVSRMRISASVESGSSSSIPSSEDLSLHVRSMHQKIPSGSQWSSKPQTLPHGWKSGLDSVSALGAEPEVVLRRGKSRQAAATVGGVDPRDLVLQLYFSVFLVLLRVPVALFGPGRRRNRHCSPWSSHIKLGTPFKSFPLILIDADR